MRPDAEPSLFQLVMWEGPISLLSLVFVIACTAILLVTRVRRSLLPLSANPVRDIALLLPGPIVALIIPILNSMSAANAMVAGGIDGEFGVLYGLKGAAVISLVGFACFVVGVIACCLPTKHPR